MLNKNLLLDINWIKEDKNQRLIYLPSFYKLYENISNLLSQKIENEGYQRVYLDEDFLFINEEYSYYFNNKKYVELRYRNSNFELSKHKTLDMLSLFENFLHEQLALPCLSGKIVSNKDSKFANYIKVNGEYFKVSELSYEEGKVEGKFNLDVVNYMLDIHKDEIGFVTPNKVSFAQVCFLMENNPFAKDIKIVKSYIDELANLGIRAILDDSNLTMKEKIEKKSKEGIPLLIEVYHKNIEKNRYTLIIRYNNEKRKISLEDFKTFKNILFDLDHKMYQTQFKKYLASEEKNIPCCMCDECISSLTEDNFELVIPFMQSQNNDLCIICGQKSKKNIKKLKII